MKIVHVIAAIVAAVGVVWFVTDSKQPDRIPIASSPPPVSPPTALLPASAASQPTARVRGAEATPSSELRVRSAWTDLQKARGSENPSDIYRGLVAIDDCVAHLQHDVSSIEPEVSAAANNDPNKDKRLRAARALAARCAGFYKQEIPHDEIMALARKAAALGHPPAQARVLSQDIIKDGVGSTSAASMTEAQQSAFCSLLGKATAAPEALVELRQIVQLAPPPKIKQEATSREKRRNIGIAFDAAACELGADCGPESMKALRLCAYQGVCGAGTDGKSPELIGKSAEELQYIGEWRQKIIEAAKGRSCAALVTQ